MVAVENLRSPKRCRDSRESRSGESRGINRNRLLLTIQGGDFVLVVKNRTNKRSASFMYLSRAVFLIIIQMRKRLIYFALNERERHTYTETKVTSSLCWNGPYASLAGMFFEPHPPFWLCYQTWLLRTPLAASMCNPAPSTDTSREISHLGWLIMKMCPDDLAKHAEVFLLMATSWASSVFFSSHWASQAYLPLRARGVSLSLTIGRVTFCVAGC